MKTQSSFRYYSVWIIKIIILGLFCSCSNSKDRFDNLVSIKDFNLKGRVKSLKETWNLTEEKFGEYQKAKFISQKIVLFNLDGSEDKSFKIGQDGQELSKTLIYYDFNGYPKEILFYENDTVNEKLVYNYNTKDRKVERSVYHPNGRLLRRFINTFNEAGNNIEENYFNFYGKLESKCIQEYDNKGNCLLMCIYKSDGRFNLRHTYSYNKNNSVIEESEYYENSKSVTTYSKYNDKGYIVEKVNTSERYIYEYLKYDEKDNWLIKIVKRFNSNYPKPADVYLIERDITYY